MLIPKRLKRPEISVILTFFNNQREAPRTLKSLAGSFQLNGANLSYEVIAIDNGSTQPLDPEMIKSFGKNFRYVFFDAPNPSPCAALNYGVKLARGRLVTICIDGARILSPGILHYSSLISHLYPNPFIYTIAMHIGRKAQNFLVEENYSQVDEDRLLAGIPWQEDGYRLFDISSLALSSRGGYLTTPLESNCMTLTRADYLRLGGYDERFTSRAGGLSNYDFFKRFISQKGITPVLLLGEATFHQFHDGTASNVALKDHPAKLMEEEYYSIRGEKYTRPFIRPVCFGRLNPHSKDLYFPQHHPSELEIPG